MSMVSYTQEELVSSSYFMRHFGEMISKLRKGSMDKIAVLKNNTIECVVIPVEQYELFQKLADYLEHEEIFSIIQQRKSVPVDEYIPLEKIV